MEARTTIDLVSPPYKASLSRAPGARQPWLVTITAVLVSSLDDQLNAVVDTGVPGAVAAVAGPGFVWEGAAGVADVETGTRLTPAHRFRIASVTKIFVATVVLQLVGEGALDLDGEVDSVIEGVKVRQLLNHTSGLPNSYDDFDSLLEPYRRDRAYRPESTPREALELVRSKSRLFPPGSGWSYSGSNYLALGLIVEETTGATIRNELRRRIAEPLGLHATDLPDDRSPPTDLARGYLPPDNPLLPDRGPGLIDVSWPCPT